MSGFQDHDQWSNDVMDQTAAFNFNLDPAIQDCFLPDDLGWLDQCLTGSEPVEDVIASRRTMNGNQDGREGSSILSRPSSPSHQCLTYVGVPSPATKVRPRNFNVTEDTRQRVQLDIAIYSDLSLPSATILSQYIARYFNTFHQHMPFLHEATWSPETAATPLLLAICANGALYSLDRTIAQALHQVAIATLSPQVNGLCALQSTMLLIAFAAWSDDVKDLGLALQLRGGITLILRQEWSSAVNDVDLPLSSWKEWIEAESRKRYAFSYRIEAFMKLTHRI